MAVLLNTFLGLKAPRAFLAMLFNESKTSRCRLTGGLRAASPVAPMAAAVVVFPAAPIPALGGGTC